MHAFAVILDALRDASISLRNFFVAAPPLRGDHRPPAFATPSHFLSQQPSMALLGISLIVASVVFVILRPPQWLWLPWQSSGRPAAITGGKETEAEKKASDRERQNRENGDRAGANRDSAAGSTTTSANTISSTLRQRKSEVDAPASLPSLQPPTIMPPIVTPPAIEEPESPTTPKAQAASPAQNVPSLSLSAEPPSMMMPPPPLPSSRSPNGRIPSLNQFPAPNSAQRARGPAPNRGLPASSSGGLAPPPTLSAKPEKPSRKVVLTPGHSPLDWARISGPNADLRGVASASPYLRVTPSMLKVHTGRKGKDAWMAINGKVYNVTPYARFHPGGVPELMRGAGRDGTKLFGEIHPWVNYETMLAACLVGLLVEETDGKESEMDKMD
ncbi:cytochrome b5 [Trichoderma arundinaceum]|uniref:Cytochrome b5 n=1 Tax=Trichoderma arundinaceum TaxID=490622 RepID=A0A395NRL2_TRIAR|nr:cytochrome b5 [Trichoderma arundinaceum]